MSEHDMIKSQSFNAPFVRIRGRLSRQGVVTWSPCLRTFHPPALIDRVAGEQEPSDSPSPEAREGEVKEGRPKYSVTLQDSQGTVLARAPVRIRFFAPERQWALFTQRLAYHSEAHRVVLLRGAHELGAIIVPNHVPEFVLVHPVKSQEIDVTGILHLHWDLNKAERANAKRFPLTYYVRYSADGHQWHRPGVNITETSFDIDLREMPGGERCVAQVIATNGYQTSYVETPPFAVPFKPPEILLATPCGPVLFAQGFSREEGPLTGDSIVWLADGKHPVGMGASFDARQLGGRMHQLAVCVTDSKGVITLQHLGWYNGGTGRQVTPRAGY